MESIVDSMSNMGVRKPHILAPCIYILVLICGMFSVFATAQTMVPYFPSTGSNLLQVGSSISPLTGAAGTTGPGADCNKPSPPDDGGVGKPSFYGSLAGATATSDSITGLTSSPSSSGGTASAPIAYGYGISTLGGNGGTGGDGFSCYGGYGGGKGGYGAGNVSSTNSSTVPINIVNNAAIVSTGVGIGVLSKGGQGGTGGHTSNSTGAGDGGIGGDGGAINIVNNSSITTSGIAPADPNNSSANCSSSSSQSSCTIYNSFGIFAQSTGGGAGNGGTDSSAIGGSGGSSKPGGAGSAIYIHNQSTATIETTYGYGMLGLSAGGFGGDGGSSSGFVASPNGAAGYGGNGGNVTVLNDGAIKTNMDGQHGLVGISVGGGGGVAGHSAALLALGGSGGSGAAGGSINTQNGAGKIETMDSSSAGVLGISIGGGGGVGGMASGAVIGGGGSGGGGGAGGQVMVVNYGSICTGGGCDAKGARSVDSSGNIYYEPTGSASSTYSPTGGAAPALAGLSIGGGGGAGGFGSSAGVPFSSSWGGAGGNGGNGGWVQVLNNGLSNAQVQTTETSSPAILAASIGGGGGTGGGAISASASATLPAVSIAVGGAGGSGGDGGPVGVNCGQTNSNSGLSSSCTNAQQVIPSSSATSSVKTYGDSSSGLMAVSIGGGGGHAGFGVALSASAINASVSLSVGGTGGHGGNGSNVYANSGGASITTYGSQSPGIDVMSIGGGGGHGGTTLQNPDYIPGGAVSPVSATLSFGGTGGGGGSGGQVIVDNMSGVIETKGQRSDGIHALSLGGHGGRGGLATGGSYGFFLSSTVSIGGNGGSGNDGGDVNVYNNTSTSSITTRGIDSHGIEAASIGGGGGTGGWSAGAGVSIASASTTVGGSGGNGAKGGDVWVSNAGTIQTYGHNSIGILAHSIGGGGGNGGSTAAGSVSLTGSLSSSVGGSGQGGSTGGSVNVFNTGTIYNGSQSVPSLSSQGILAMSIGGGGGHGGIAVAGSVGGYGAISDSVGGGSGNGGTGGDAYVSNTGTIQSVGALANGVTAMSVGGRGGFGGIAIGAGLSLGVPMGVSLGSTGGNGGNAGNATVYNAGEITGIGFRAIGVTAQSIGGNGGLGGISVGANLSLPTPIPASTISIGGSGGSGGRGGFANVDNEKTGSISTIGPYSSAVVVQSIGGDGGIGGIGIGAATSLVAPSITLGGSGGSGAIGDEAYIYNLGKIATSGVSSTGLIAQSIGGHGGISGFVVSAGTSSKAEPITAALGAIGGGGGANGAYAHVYGAGKVSTSGALSTGIVAESIGGGGGRSTSTITLDGLNTLTGDSALSSTVGASAGGSGNGGKAFINQSGIIQTTGTQSDGMYAGSIGGGGGSDASYFVNLSKGSKSYTVAIGGNAGGSGNGGIVEIDNNQDASISTSYKVSTTGNFSDGVVAQSVGGGGGTSTSVHSQSASGGTYSTMMRLGASGSHTGGDGGSVSLYLGGILSTQGIGSTGVLGQSIGGGGGKSASGLFASSQNLSLVIPFTAISISAGNTQASSTNSKSGFDASDLSTDITAATSWLAGSLGAIHLGAFSDNQKSNGGTIDLTATGQYLTHGDLSDAIKLQSIGGGGGFSAIGDFVSSSPFSGTSMYLGGGGSYGGDGNTITAQQSYSISTYGNLSSGFLIQSIGGGGGDARQDSTSVSGITSGFASLLGLKAQGQGGSGGKVTLSNYGAVATSGVGSDGLVAQSIGGGGGISALYGASSWPLPFVTSSDFSSANSQVGQNLSSLTSSSYSSAFAGITSTPDSTNAGSYVNTVRGISYASVLGASGGSSNNGDKVEIINNAWVTTGNTSGRVSDGSIAIIGQSIGAGGGITRNHLDGFDQAQTSLALLLGATHNADGDSASVTISSNNLSGAESFEVYTAGRGSMGILGQSIGGGGGLGILTEATPGYGGSAAIGMILGSQNTSHGDASSVTINSGGIIVTNGDQAEGIVAQSISDGGGVAKASIVSALSGTQWGTGLGTASWSNGHVNVSANSGLAASVQLGSNSSNGNNSDNVTITSSSQITTYGNRSTAIVAQSISGGGGIVDLTFNNLNGGNFTGSVTMGGVAPGQVGAVNVTSNSGIVTGTINSKNSGIFADGVVAQSITYGGGSFGLVHQTNASTGNGSLNFLLGAINMGTSVNAQPVSVTVTDIMTSGYGASAITAQSIGGGGGLLGYYVPQGSIPQGTISGSGTLGGYGNGHGSDGSQVTVKVNGYITTNGDMSPMIIAQSIGGGGGRVVGNASIYQDVPGIKLGDSYSNGESRAVSVTTAYPLASGGNNSPGIIAQSIGGGGGILNFPTSSLSNVQFGGYNSASDSVTVTTNGSITTLGYGSFGILAQSIAGGGGFASMSGTATFGSLTTSGGNNAGSVTVTNNAAISTNQNASPGIIAVSIGGGGGVAVLPQDTVYSYGLNKGSGNGGDVVVNVKANITTLGNGSDGVDAVSIGGGGGLMFYNNGLLIEGGAGRGTAGNISVSVAPNVSILTSGTGSTAIRVMQVNGRDDPVVNIAPGAVVIGGPGGTGVSISGAINYVNNNGYLSTFDGINGRSVISDSGTTTVNNRGTTVGDITLAGSGNVINNLTGGRMYLAHQPDIGSDGVLYNSGFLQFNPNGLSGLGALAHTGRLVQLGGGVLGMQYDHHAAAFALGTVASSISAGAGSYLELGGSISPTLVNAGLIAPGSAGPTTIISNNGGTLIHDQLGVVNTAIMSYGLIKDANSVQLTSTANFAPVGLSPYASQVGSAIGAYQTAGSNALFQAATAQLVTIPTVGSLDQAYTSLAGTAIQAMPQANYQAVTRAVGTVSDRMNSWRVGDSFIATTKNPRALMTGMASMNQPMTPNAPQVANGTLSADGGQMLITSLAKTTDARTWITPFGGTSNSNNLADQIYGGSLGIEAQSDDRQYIGGAALTVSQSNYTYSSTTTPATPGAATNYGAQFYFGARSNSAYLSAIGYLGGSSGNFTRQLQALGFYSSTGVNVHSNILGARVEAGYNLLPNPEGKRSLQITPFVAIQPTQIRQNGANEYFGGIGSGFYYGSNINTAVPLYLGAEISGDLDLGDKEVLKPFLRVSWAHDLMSPMTMNAAYNPGYGPTLYANGTPSMGNMVIVKGGAKYNWGTKVSAYATLDIEQGNAAYSFRGIGGSIGAIYSW